MNRKHRRMQMRKNPAGLYVPGSANDPNKAQRGKPGKCLTVPVLDLASRLEDEDWIREVIGLIARQVRGRGLEGEKLQILLADADTLSLPAEARAELERREGRLAMPETPTGQPGFDDRLRKAPKLELLR